MEYDIIGDIHGHAAPLEQLLGNLGYVEKNGAYRNACPNRMVIFLGDIIDRGPDQLGSIDIVRRMMDAGTAQCLMGNHEHAAVGWFLPDPDNDGAYMRPHNAKNFNQHRVFLEQIGEDSAFRREIADWMLSLPLYLDLQGIRCVHACWQPAIIESLGHLTNGTGKLAGKTLYDSFRKGHDTREAVDISIRGREVDLPDGITFVDSDGTERDKSRVRWWAGEIPTKLRDMIVDDIDTDADADPGTLYLGQDEQDTRPVFFGHYWMQGEPRLMGSRATCLDFSVAAGGDLCAYSWRGEDVLTPDGLSWVSNRFDVEKRMKLG